MRVKTQRDWERSSELCCDEQKTPNKKKYVKWNDDEPNNKKSARLCDKKQILCKIIVSSHTYSEARALTHIYIQQPAKSIIKITKRKL